MSLPWPKDFDPRPFDPDDDDDGIPDEEDNDDWDPEAA